MVTEVLSVPVIVGSGVAGLVTALRLPGSVVVTKGAVGDGSTGHAQGGIAAAVGPDDSPAAHASDTLSVGGGLVLDDVAAEVVGAAPRMVEWLQAIGTRFDRSADGRLDLGREAGHNADRILHADGDATGRELIRALRAAVAARPDITVLEQTEVIDLATSAGSVVGVVTRSTDGIDRVLVAPAVVLATGGIGGLFDRTTNPPGVNGGGLAVAARAGALLGDLEFVQFHPTALVVDQDPLPLLTEALRGAGA
ncbi:MAG: FAD-dependent oxidoreductase, partial [Acidimicrobiia bacterium]|nr:FAD-dependent oxidoreductase [Acidimicrobiia bacterium]